MVVEKPIRERQGINLIDLVCETITASEGKDLEVYNATGKDVVITFTDAAGARKLLIVDSDAQTVGYWDSNGKIYAAGGLEGALTGNVTGNLTGNVTGNVTGNINGQCRTTYAHSDTDGAPTNAECIAAFGAAATVGAGFIGIYKDDHASGKEYVCVSNGTTYSVSELTAAA